MVFVCAGVRVWQVQAWAGCVPRGGPHPLAGSGGDGCQRHRRGAQLHPGAAQHQGEGQRGDRPGMLLESHPSRCRHHEGPHLQLSAVCSASL